MPYDLVGCGDALSADLLAARASSRGARAARAWSITAATVSSRGCGWWAFRNCSSNLWARRRLAMACVTMLGQTIQYRGICLPHRVTFDCLRLRRHLAILWKEASFALAALRQVSG